MPGILANATRKPTFVAVERDDEGVRMALRELLEEGFQIIKIERTSMAEPAKQKQIALVLSGRKMATGYYRWAAHLLRLDAERNAGIPLDPNTLASFEANGLRMLAVARNQYRAAHPPCGACGVEQDSRFHPHCIACGTKFRRKGA